jgi:hypothetical protein
MADGSSITNVSTSGLPTQTENRAYAFCLGTQILQNPASDPRTGTLSFKVSTELFDVAQGGDTVGTTAIGLATSDNISSIATWAPNAEISDDGSTYEVYAVSFAEDSVESTLVNVAIGGASVDTLAKNRTASGVDTVLNTINCTAHGYQAGDAVVIVSGDVPSPLATGITYYTIPSGADKFALALTRAAAISGLGNEVDITTTESPIHLESDDVFVIARDGVSGNVTVTRNGATISSGLVATSETLRPFFWTRESSNSASIPVFKEIKVSGAS